jgi:hypothetical protein
VSEGGVVFQVFRLAYWCFVAYYTTTLSSFTDGLIPSVTAMKSVGENNTDGVPDGSAPSVNQLSVNPISVANSVANKKNHPPTVIQTDTRAKKKFLAETLPTANPSVILRVITDGITDGFFVGNYGMACNFVATLCVIPTDIIRR